MLNLPILKKPQYRDMKKIIHDLLKIINMNKKQLKIKNYLFYELSTQKIKKSYAYNYKNGKLN